MRVGGVEAGEAGKRTDLAEPLGLDHVGEKRGQRLGDAWPAEREVVGRVGGGVRGEDLPFGGEQVGVVLGGATAAGLGFLTVALDCLEEFVLRPLGQHCEMRELQERVEYLLRRNGL